MVISVSTTLSFVNREVVRFLCVVESGVYALKIVILVGKGEFPIGRDFTASLLSSSLSLLCSRSQFVCSEFMLFPLLED